jgi:CheY-like chemotaxis protein
MTRKKILIIDDEPIWHRLLKQLFAGYEVQAAEGCADGVKLAETFKPDCILLDFYLKDGNAIKVCEALRKGGTEFETPIVVVSSNPGVEIDAYEECRTDYFVLKGSHTMMELTTIVEKLTRKDGTDTGKNGFHH